MAIYGYARVSTEQQVDGASLAEQERRIRAIASYHGLPVEAMFRDEGVSGKIPLGQRPEGMKLMARIKEGDTIIVSKMDRAFRSARDALMVIERLRVRGINLTLADMGTEPVTQDGVGKLFFLILAGMAEFERERIRERTLEGKKFKEAKGGYAGGFVKYGHNVEGRGRDAMLVRDDEADAMVARAVELRKTKVKWGDKRSAKEKWMSYADIAEILASEYPHRDPPSHDTVWRWVKKAAPELSYRKGHKPPARRKAGHREEEAVW